MENAKAISRTTAPATTRQGTAPATTRQGLGFGRLLGRPVQRPLAGFGKRVAILAARLGFALLGSFLHAGVVGLEALAPAVIG